MIIGVFKEIKNNENCVVLISGGVFQFILNGYWVLVEIGVGFGSGFENEVYELVGVEIMVDLKQVWDVEMVMKVKELLLEEYVYFCEGFVLFMYFYLVVEFKLIQVLKDKGVMVIVYEMVSDGWILLFLMLMLEVVGRMVV